MVLGRLVHSTWKRGWHDMVLISLWSNQRWGGPWCASSWRIPILMDLAFSHLRQLLRILNLNIRSLKLLTSYKAWANTTKFQLRLLNIFRQIVLLGCNKIWNFILRNHLGPVLFVCLRKATNCGRAPIVNYVTTYLATRSQLGSAPT
jgi:hypothetical protein